MKYIYTLQCPESHQVRYVGKCKELQQRFRSHISESKLGKIKSHKCAWIRSLLRLGLKPIIAVDVVVPDGADWKEIERSRISHYRSMGFRLTNTTDGGDGETILTDEQRQALSERQRKIYSDPTLRSMISSRMKELWKDPIYAKNQSEAVKKACSDEGYLRLLSERMKSNGALPEVKERRSRYMKELSKNKDLFEVRTLKAKKTRSSVEYRERMSKRSKEAWSKPGYLENIRTKRLELGKDPAFIAKLSASVKSAQSSDEFRKMKSDQMKLVWAARKNGLLPMPVH